MLRSANARGRAGPECRAKAVARLGDSNCAVCCVVLCCAESGRARRHKMLGKGNTDCVCKTWQALRAAEPTMTAVADK